MRLPHPPSLAPLFLLLSVASAQTPPLPPVPPRPRLIEVVRDPQGVPHVFAPSDTGACKGAGYVAACDRLFQMEFFRRSMSGRLAEIFPLDPYAGALDSDKRARTLGFARYATELLADAAFDAATRSLLQAYADGVNVRLAELRAGTTPWPPMFLSLLGPSPSMEDWSAADCVLVWMFAQDLFGAFEWKDLHPGQVDPYAQGDPGGAVLSDLGNGQFARLERSRPGPRGSPAVEAPRKASHNLVLHGSATASGQPLLLAKPQHRLMSPSLYYEYAMTASQGTLDCRGAGLAGCPAFFHGWNRFAAWSMTSMPADVSDVYAVSFVDNQHTQYRVDGDPPLSVQNYPESILLTDGSLVPWRHRRTKWGPLISDFECGSPRCGLANPVEHSMRSLVFDDALLRKQHSITGALELMRAGAKSELVAATAKWRSPGGHMLVATTAGDIGYRALTGLPRRPASSVPLGVAVLNGNTNADDWQGEITTLPKYYSPLGQASLPFLSSANNLACDPALIAAAGGQAFTLGFAGDTVRSWRLREWLSARVQQSPDVSATELLGFDHDTVQPLLRTFVALSRAVQAHLVSQGGGLQGRALTAFNNLGPWLAPWPLDAGVPAPVYRQLMALADALSTFAHSDTSPWKILVEHFGSRTHNVIKMLRPLAGQETSYRSLFPYPNELELWVADELDDALVALAGVTETANQFTIAHQDNYKPLIPGSLGNWPPKALALNDLTCVNLATIWSQSGETYKFLADFAHFPDGTVALLAPGVSEDWTDNSPTGLYDNHLAAWKAGTMYPAPLTRGFPETLVKNLPYP